MTFHLLDFAVQFTVFGFYQLPRTKVNSLRNTLEPNKTFKNNLFRGSFSGFS